MKILLENGANVNITDISGHTVLHYTLPVVRNNEVIKLLTDNDNVDVNIPDNNGLTAFDIINYMEPTNELYKELYQKFRPEVDTYFNHLPNEILAMTLKEPGQIIDLCKNSTIIKNKLCADPNSDFWRSIYQNNFGVDPTFNPVRKSYMQQYIELYDSLYRKPISPYDADSLQNEIVRVLKSFVENDNLKVFSIILGNVNAKIREKVIRDTFKLSAENNAIKIAKYIIDSFSNYLIIDDYNTAITSALDYNHLQFAKYIAGLNRHNPSDIYVNDFLINDDDEITGSDPELVELLINLGVDKYGRKLWLFAARGFYDSIKKIVEMRGDQITIIQYRNAIASAEDATNWEGYTFTPEQEANYQSIANYLREALRLYYS